MIAERSAGHEDAALAALAERYRGILEEGPIGVFEVHRDGTVRYANPAIAQAAGYASPEAMIGVNILEHYVDADERAALYRMLGERGSVNGFPVRLRAKHGEVRYLLLSATVQGALTRGVSVDVTELHEKESALQTSLELNRRILEVMPGGVVHVNADGSIVHANPEACRVLGLSFDELLQKYTQDFETHTIHEDGSPCSAEHYPVTQAILSGEPQPPHTIGVRRLDGETSWAVFRAVPVKEPTSGNATGAVVTFIDITSRKADERAQAENDRAYRNLVDNSRALEEQLRHAQKLESLGLLAGGIAHDFNNLLAAILGNASLAKIHLGDNPPAADAIAALEVAAQRAADLTRQMLTYAGRSRPVARALDISSLVREMAELLSAVISKRAVLKSDFPEKLPLIDGDPAQIQQVIMNLILNASDALDDQVGTISLRAGTRTMSREDLRRTYVDDGCAPGEYVFVEVSDTGRGMDATTRARVFDPFFTTKSTGRGLGLAATLGTVRGHKGAIEVESEAGAGTTFRVFFPVSDQAEKTLSEPASRPETQNGSATVLVVDDEKVVRDVTGKLLQELGYHVLIADGGKAALSTYEKQRENIDVVLLDMTMADMTGAEVLDELVRIQPGVRVVLCSGFTEEHTFQRISSAFQAGFLQKPYTASALINAIEGARER